MDSSARWCALTLAGVLGAGCGGGGDEGDASIARDASGRTDALARFDAAEASDATSSNDAAEASDAASSSDASIARDAIVADDTLRCPASLPREVFRDDFDGDALDPAIWQVQDFGAGSGGTFTQLTTMRRENVVVSGGTLALSSMRHCEEPRANRSAPAHPASCASQNYYSGAWVRTREGYAPGRGLMVFRAKLPPPVRGFFPALWARNTEGEALYVELDLIEMTWDDAKGVEATPGTFKVTTHFGPNASIHAQGPAVGPFEGLTSELHVWEVEWDAEAAPAVVRYFYRDSPGAERVLLRETTVASSGFAGRVSEEDFREGLRRGFRVYADFAVMPETRWSVGVDSAPTYAPEDLLVDSVIVCAP